MQPEYFSPVTEIPYFEAVTGFSPYPWQQRCYAELLANRPPATLSLPTASGKTSVILLYLLALAQGISLPRRLAYVVDRRSIVDQTTAEIERWIEAITRIPELTERFRSLAAFPQDDWPIQVGTLRGGLADTSEWRLDPAQPTVIVGTVDMLGSRLLFRGYGDGRNRRALHAGLLGMDTTLILDESHLSPAFAATLGDVRRLHQPCLGKTFHTLTMSATPREGERETFGELDLEHPALGRRLRAVKRLIEHKVDIPRDRRARMAEIMAGYQRGAIIAFVASAQEAQQLLTELVKQLGKERSADVALITGTLRGHERQALIATELWRRFARPEPEDEESEPVFLIATAAGEVGVDLDADHLVMDLAPLDSVIQRLGRVNRSGRCQDSQVHLVHCPKDTEFKPEKTDARTRLVQARYHTLELLRRNPVLSPLALLAIPEEEAQQAASPSPNCVPLEMGRLTLLAATGAGLELPPVAPFLRGVSDDPEPPETQLLWRGDVDLLLSSGLAAARDALAMLPPRPRELLKVPTHIAAADLTKLAEAQGPFQCLRLAADGSLEQLEVTADKAQLDRPLRHATLFLPTVIGGLSEAGFLDPRRAGKTVTDIADDEDGLRFELREGTAPDLPPWIDKAVQWRLPLHDPDDDEAAPAWWVYAKRRPGELALNVDSDLSRLSRQLERLDDHNRAVGQAAARIGRALRLPAFVVEALETAGTLHDEGKARRVWQRAAGNRHPEPVAKTPRGQFQPGLLGGYRHEFGSLAEAERHLPAEPGDYQARLRRALTLHLIAAHHGHARPGFAHPRQWDPELPQAQSEALALTVERRYAMLQQHFGPWGLAWLEALLKCADARVSSGLATEGGSYG